MNDVRTLMIAVGIGMLAAAPGPVKFHEQEIAKDFGVGYAVAPGDVNGDGKTDIIAISGTELVWFKAPDWEKTVILAAGATTADNVTIAPHDIDGDGRLDVALGAGWTGQNTGTLQWVRQNAPGRRRRGKCSPFPPSRHCIGSSGLTSTATRSSNWLSRRCTAREPPMRAALPRACWFSGLQPTPGPTRGRWRSPARRITSSTTSCR